MKIRECIINEENKLVVDGSFNPRIFTYSGEIADVDNPPPLHDMAICLGRIPRFCGNTLTYWPVLGHVINAGNIAYKMRKDNVIGHCMLHDGSESLLGDIPSPFKTKDTKSLEDKIITNVYKKYNLKVTESILEDVEFVDRLCLILEAELLLCNRAANFFTEVYSKSIGLSQAQRNIGIPLLAKLVYIANKEPKSFWPEGWLVAGYCECIKKISEGSNQRKEFELLINLIEKKFNLLIT